MTDRTFGRNNNEVKRHSSQGIVDVVSLERLRGVLIGYSANSGPPPTPVNVKAAIVGDKPGEDQMVDLTWEMPEAVEATPADVETVFMVEMKPDSGTRWQPVELAAPLKDTKVMLPAKDMKEYTDYVFRVTAKNKAGSSKPSEPSNKVQTGEHSRATCGLEVFLPLYVTARCP